MNYHLYSHNLYYRNIHISLNHLYFQNSILFPHYFYLQHTLYYLLKNFHKVLDNEFERKGGADKKAMKNLFNQISKEWSSMDWVPDARLQNKLKLLGACVAEDSKQIVSCLEFGLDKQLVPKWNYDLWVMLSTLDFVNVKEGKVDSKRILALKTRIQGYFANSPSILKRLDPYFEKFN